MTQTPELDPFALARRSHSPAVPPYKQRVDGWPLVNLRNTVQGILFTVPIPHLLEVVTLGLLQSWNGNMKVESRISRSLDDHGAPPSPSAEASILRANLGRARALHSRQSSSNNFPTPSSTLSNLLPLFDQTSWSFFSWFYAHVAAFDPYNPRDRDVYQGNRQMRRYVENSVMMMRRNATDQSHYNLNSGFPNPRPEEVTRQAPMGVHHLNQLETDDVLYYSVDPDGVPSAKRYVPSSSAAAAAEEEDVAT
ncbi:hypothetical protein C8R42DRAFT_722037 [Lentinula raphanica]|nr:hypothetical protein C8R42DRAFT_722037 [Lentinula raphanica]